MPGLTQNPLAAPGILGINAGAASAVVVLVFGNGTSSPPVIALVAFFGASLAAIAVYFLGSLGPGGLTPLNLTVAGAALTALLSSLTTGVLILSERTLEEVRFWLAGSLYLNSTDIFRLPTKAVAQQLGILPQGPVAPEGLTVQDLVAQGRYPYHHWWQSWTLDDESEVQKALNITDPVGLAERPVDTLSGGQRQRAWIAMTLAQNTQILLLDEPTTFLDLAHQVEVLDLLWDLNQLEGRTIVMVLHDLNQACRYAHNLVALRDRQIFARGNPEEVMTEEMVQQVFGLACRIVPDPVVGTPLCVPLGRHFHSGQSSS